METPTRELPCRAFPTRAFHSPEVAHTAQLLVLLDKCKGMELEPIGDGDGVVRAIIDDYSLVP